MTGAAIATNIGRGTAVVIQLWMLGSGRSRIHIRRRHIEAGSGDGIGRIAAERALAGEQLRPGEAWVAPGNHHLTVVRAGGEKLALSLSLDPPVNCCRPSIDVLFESVAEGYRDRAIAAAREAWSRSTLRVFRYSSVASFALFIVPIAHSPRNRLPPSMSSIEYKNS